MTGLVHGTVTLSESDPAWPKLAGQAIKELARLLDGCAVNIEHVGSTAIPGIKAKPVIDIAIAVKSFAPVLERVKDLERNGYRFVDSGEPWQLYFVRQRDGLRTLQVHIVLSGEDEWASFVAFRDYLCANPHRAREYEALKLSLAQAYPRDAKTYTLRKAQFIQRVLDEAAQYRTLGRRVDIEVDMPLGSPVPGGTGLVCPVNCGVIPGANSPDGGSQRAYLLGVDRPVQSCAGRVITIITHGDGMRSWVVAPMGRRLYEPQIRSMLAFAENGADTVFRCLYEKSCGAVTFTRQGGKTLFLLVRNLSGAVGFPKGHVELGENEHETATREIREEAGLAVRFLGGFRRSCSYHIYTAVHKQTVYYLARFTGDIRPQAEEIPRYWLATYKEALGLISFENDRNILRQARLFLGKKRMEIPESS